MVGGVGSCSSSVLHIAQLTLHCCVNSLEESRGSVYPPHHVLSHPPQLIHVLYPVDYWISFTLCSYCNYAIVQVAIGRKLKVAIITPIAHCPSAVSSLPAHLTIGKNHSPLQLPTRYILPASAMDSNMERNG